MKIKKNKAAVALATLTGLNLVGGVLPAHADTLVDEGSVSVEGSHTYTAATGNYVKENFNFSTSANVTLSANEDNARMGVGTAHSDGQYAYAGSTDGGIVGTCGDKYDPGSTSLAGFDETGCTE